MDRMKALVIVTLLCLPQARAQSTNASPDLTRTDAPFDPAKSASLPEPAKAAVTQAEKQMKSGALAGFIFAASPDLKVWTLKAAPKTTSDFSRADLARTTLEACDFNADQPCKILSVDGYDTRQKAGGWPKQPDALIQRPGDLNSSVLPFVPAAERPKAAAYQKAVGPRAFALTTGGVWLWRGGTTIGQAIDKTLADCAAQFKDEPCILYAVNNRVVFGSR